MTNKQYPPLPEPFHTSAYLVVSKTRSRTGERRMYSEAQMRAYVDADRAQRLQLTDAQCDAITAAAEEFWCQLGENALWAKYDNTVTARAEWRRLLNRRNDSMRAALNNPSRPDAGNTQE